FVWVLDVQPMSTSFNNGLTGMGKPRGDRLHQLFSDECINAAANHQHRAAVRTDCGRVVDSVVPDVDISGNDARQRMCPSAHKPIELVLAEARRELGPGCALCPS